MLKRTKEFLQALYDSENPMIAVRLIKTNPPPDLIGTYEDLKIDISFYHKKKYNVYYVVNEAEAFEGKAVKDKDITHAHACFIDIDNGEVPGFFPLEPSAIVSRADGKGHHIYFFLDKPLEIKAKTNRKKWVAAQETLIDFYKSDTVIKNPSRLMRLPGTYNVKEKLKKPLLYEVKELNTHRYSITDIIKAHQSPTNINSILDSKIADIFKGEPLQDGEGRHDTLIKITMLLNDYGYTEDQIFTKLQWINNKFLADKKTDNELKKIAAAHKYAKNKDAQKTMEADVKLLIRCDIVREALTDWYYVLIGGFFINVSQVHVTMSLPGFNAKFAYITEQVNAAGFVFKHDLVKFAQRITFEPEFDIVYEEEGNTYVNLWRPIAFEPQKGKVSWFVDHIKYLFPVPEEHNYVLDFLAHTIQKPREKIRHALVLIGGQGVGKSILINLFYAIFGKTGVVSPGNQTLNEKFTGWAVGRQIAFIDEIEQSDKKDFINKIKPAISEDILEVREMFKEPYTINNYMNFIATTNDIQPVLLAQDDRRFMILRSDAQSKQTGGMGKKEVDNYYQGFADKCYSQTPELLHFFKSRDLKDFYPNARPPMTAAKQEIIDLSKSEIERLIEMHIADVLPPFQYPVVTIDEVLEFFESHRYFKYKLVGGRIIKVLRKLGCVSVGSQIRFKGAQRRFWAVREISTWMEYAEAGVLADKLTDLYTAYEETENLFETGAH